MEYPGVARERNKHLDGVPNFNRNITVNAFSRFKHKRSETSPQQTLIISVSSSLQRSTIHCKYHSNSTMKFIVPLSLLTLSAAAIDDGVIDPFIKSNNLRSRGLVPGKGNNGTLFPSHSSHLYDVLSRDVHNIWNTLLTNLIYNMM